MRAYSCDRPRPPTNRSSPHVRRPEIAGEFNTFAEPGHERAPAHVGRMIVALDDGTPIGSVSWHGVGYGPNLRSRAWNIGITIIPSPTIVVVATGPRPNAGSPSTCSPPPTPTGRGQHRHPQHRRAACPRARLERAGAWHDLVLYPRLRDDG